MTDPVQDTPEQIDAAVKFVCSRGYAPGMAQAIVAKHGAQAILADSPQRTTKQGLPAPGAVVGTAPDARTDYERHSDLLAEVADHGAPVGGAQVMHKVEEPAAPAEAEG